VEIAGLPPDLSEELRRNALQLGNPAILAPQILTDDVPLPVVVRVRPLVGALTALTAAPVTAGGTLLRARLAQTQGEMGILIDQALVYGRFPPAKPGRTDDFRWPKE
jgi:uncharacterized protein